MILENLDLGFTQDKTCYDPNKNLKIRLVCSYEWDTIDWSRNKKISKYEINVGTIIIHYHGGGFIGNSSASQRLTL